MNTALVPYVLVALALGAVLLLGLVELIRAGNYCTRKNQRTPEQLRAPAPAPGTVPVEVRSYPNAALFAQDAASMATAGWNVVAQSNTRKGGLGRALLAGIVTLVVVALIAGILIGLIAAVVVGIASGAGGSEVFTVTYQPRS
jgi:hypothetical protein